MLIKNKNFSLGKLSNLSVNNGDTFQDCNFTRPIAHTSICEGYTGLTFIDCNLFNCDVPGDSVIEGCLTIHRSCCSHLHSEWGLPECTENCSHVVDVDEVWIDGILVDKTYHYKNTIV